MNHIQKATDAVFAAGLAAKVYMNNDHVFAFDILQLVQGRWTKPLWVAVGHAVFAGSTVCEFVDGRIGEQNFTTLDKTKDVALDQFVTALASVNA